MTDEKKVSIIVPVYNVQGYLDRFIKSVLRQSFDMKAVEIIFVDDGSTDGSAGVISGYTEEHPSIKVIIKENGGAASARNRGLEAATGEYVAFLDPDDYIEKEYLEIAYSEAIEKDADIVLFDAFRECADPDGGAPKVIVWNHALSEFVTTDKEDFESMQCQILYPYMSARAQGVVFEKDVPLSAPWDKLYRRKFLLENDLKFPEELKVLDDMCFNFDVFGKAAKIAYVPIPLYHYCVQEGTITNGYRENRPELDMQVFAYLKEKIEGLNVPLMQQAYYARIIKSFAICCRLCFFNRMSPLSADKQLEKVKEYMCKEPYEEAFKSVDKDLLDWKLALVTYAGMYKKPRLLKILYVLQSLNSR